ncbi:MAG TPA: SRPBCC family protein [Ignavibacteriaceae bacterium]|nr:SRPBCC family protein [Ignavibacteriaceae bacterium]
MTGLSLEKSVVINAPVEKVWDALVNPKIIKKYLFGTDAVSDWKEGSPLQFKGVYEGKEYADKGTILKSEPNKFLQYSYFSSFSNMEDKKENYQIVSYKLSKANGGTKLTLKQENIHDQKSKEHSEENWSGVLNTLKSAVESE